jgi:toluene monooxygenase electron transfer component
VLFDHLQPGRGDRARRPYGVAYLRTGSPRDIVCVAGGSGLAPMISIARGAAEAGMLGRAGCISSTAPGAPRRVRRADAGRAGGFGERITYCPVVSSRARGLGGCHGLRAYRLPPGPAGTAGGYEFYFAGPPPMTQALQEMLMVDHRVPFEQIHFDRFF